jgi:hypothetical protein
MTATTPQDVQAKIDAGLNDMVGAAAANFLAARAEAGELVAPAPPTAGFTAKEG